MGRMAVQCRLRGEIQTGEITMTLEKAMKEWDDGKEKEGERIMIDWICLKCGHEWAVKEGVAFSYCPRCYSGSTREKEQ